MTLAMYRVDSSDSESFLLRLEARGGERLGEAEKVARGVICQVEAEGDSALVRLGKQYDGVDMRAEEIRVPIDRVRQIAATAPAEVRGALKQAASRIQRFHEAQRQALRDFEIEVEGVRMGQRAMPIDRAGVYVPGGKAAYPSTVLMNVIPARIAGVAGIAVATPPGSLERNPAVAAALELMDINEVYCLGGAQAVAALALGTETVRAVDKIVGPGNLFVSAAKRLVAGRVGIDAIAGPTEVLVVADGTARPAWIAADLLAQAEHDEEASSVALVPTAEMAAEVGREVKQQIEVLPRKEIIRASLVQYGAVLVYSSREEAAVTLNRIAPEHLALHVREPRTWHASVRHAGSVFLGEHAAEVLGDYGCGPNHVLPTMRSSRFESALGVTSFLRLEQWLEADSDAARRAADMVETLARAEGFEAHARAMSARREVGS